MGNWRQTAVWVIVPVVVAAAAVGLGAFFFLREAGRAGEATAKVHACKRRRHAPEAFKAT